MSTPSKSRGAPKGNRNAAKEATLDSVVSFRCQRDDKGRWVAAARAKGMSLREWILMRLNSD